MALWGARGSLGSADLPARTARLQKRGSCPGRRALQQPTSLVHVCVRAEGALQSCQQVTAFTCY